MFRRIAFWTLFIALSTVTGFGASVLAKAMGMQNPLTISAAASFSYGFLLAILVTLAISIHED